MSAEISHHKDKRQKPFLMSAEQIDLVKSALGENHHLMLQHLGSGAFNDVFAWGDGAAVVKIPKKIPLVGYPSAQQLQTEIDILNEYRIPIPQTAIAKSSKIDTGLIIAGYLDNFHPLTKKMLDDFEIRKQFEDILEANQAMIQDRGCSIDRVGFDVAVRSPISAIREVIENNRNIPISSNLVVADTGKVWYTDSNVLWLCKTPHVDSKITAMHTASQWFVDKTYGNIFRHRKQKLKQTI